MLLQSIGGFLKLVDNKNHLVAKILMKVQDANWVRACLEVSHELAMKLN